jgi:hypothetical protein
MKRTLTAKIQKEIRKRAFERADYWRKEKRNIEKTQHTLDALQEVTGLHRAELESIADSVTLSFRLRRDDFFSIKNQILITFGVFGLSLILGGFVLIF